MSAALDYTKKMYHLSIEEQRAFREALRQSVKITQKPGELATAKAGTLGSGLTAGRDRP